MKKAKLKTTRSSKSLWVFIGAIRQPTVEKPILRVIPRIGSSKKLLKSLLNHF